MTNHSPSPVNPLSWSKVHRKTALNTSAKPETAETGPGVLIIDDDEHVRMLLRSVLKRGGWSVWTAADGVQAVSTFKQREQQIKIVLLDFHMPGLDGLETLHFLRQLEPRLICCFMSGLIDEETRVKISCTPNTHLLAKPFLIDKLSKYLYDLLANPSQSTT